jgi:hypothetical protein
MTLLVVCLFGLTVTALAQEQNSTLDRAAALVNGCIAEQTAAELGKGTAPRAFEIVLRDKCRSQEQRFRATLISGLKKEGSLNRKALRLIDELLTALRQRAVEDYVGLLEKPSWLVKNRLVAV